jgi:hypothetical protein
MCHMLRTIIASGICLSRTRFKLARCLAYAAVTGLSGVSASSQTAVKIVGIGAVPCSEFTRESKPHPVVEKYFFGWAQGYMSGLLQRAPAGVDEGVDLVPPAFPMEAQADFLRVFCARHPSADFADAVTSLYRELRSQQTR